MLILDEHNKSIIIDTLYDPIVSDYMWVLDLAMMDFTLAPIKMLEEVVSSTMTLEIAGYEFKIPSYWYMLVYDEITTQLDSVSVSDLTTNSYTALVYGPDMHVPEAQPVNVVNYDVTSTNVYPTFNRHLMMCHPISANKWINISFSDSYNRFLRDKYVSDLIF